MNHQDYLDEQRKAIRDRMVRLYPRTPEITESDRTAEFLVNYEPPTMPEQYIIRPGEPATRLKGLYNAMDAAYREYVERCYYDRI